VCWRAKTITGATKDVVLHLGDLVHMGKSRHALINPAIRIVARQKRYLLTSFFPFTMRDHAFTIIAGQWALYDAASVVQRQFRAHLKRSGRGKKAKHFPFKILYRPVIAMDSATGIARFVSTSETMTDFGGDGEGSWSCDNEIGGAADLEILSDLQNGVQGLDETPFKHIIKTFEVPSTMRQVYTALLSDSSPFTEDVHLKNQVATDVKIGKWRPSAQADEPSRDQAANGVTSATSAGGRSRELTFTQKIDNPLSPIKQGRGFWYQRVGWLASGVLCYQTFSMLKDVPFCDSWAIQKKWIIRPAGDAGIDSPVCQVTCSIECVFFKRILWSGKLESETVSQATKDYQVLAEKISLFLRSPPGLGRTGSGRVAPLLVAAPSPPVRARAGETEVEMLRRRLAVCERLLSGGVAVRVGGSGWLGGVLGGSKAAPDKPDFVVRAAFDAQSEEWHWKVNGQQNGYVSDTGKFKVSAWPAGAALPA